MPTAERCRARAADNDAQAAATDLVNRREQFVASAKAWRERADMFERIGRSTVARRAGHREARDAAAVG